MVLASNKTPMNTTTGVLEFQRDSRNQTLQVSGGIAHKLLMPIGLEHVARLSTDTGILEHAEGAIGRREHGYCTDDVARQLLVASLYGTDSSAQRLAEQGLQFLRHACVPDGRFRSRMNYARLWIDDGASDDACGRAVWGLGVAAANAPWPHIRKGALGIFHQASSFRSPFWHATAFATLGASAVLEKYPNDDSAQQLLVDAGSRLPLTPYKSSWKWHEDHLTYASAVLPDALLALAAVNPLRTDEALTLLQWLVSTVVQEGRLSVVPTTGLYEHDQRPAFDQQPIEAQALASAAWRAWLITNDLSWLELVIISAAWFVGHNDTATPLVDRETNGCSDGLQKAGRNENQGAESTLAMLHVMAILNQAVASGSVILQPDAQLESAPDSDTSLFRKPVKQTGEHHVSAPRTLHRGSTGWATINRDTGQTSNIDN